MPITPEFGRRLEAMEKRAEELMIVAEILIRHAVRQRKDLRRLRAEMQTDGIRRDDLTPDMIGGPRGEG